MKRGEGKSALKMLQGGRVGSGGREAEVDARLSRARLCRSRSRGGAAAAEQRGGRSAGDRPAEPVTGPSRLCTGGKSVCWEIAPQTVPPTEKKKKKKSLN